MPCCEGILIQYQSMDAQWLAIDAVTKQSAEGKVSRRYIELSLQSNVAKQKRICLEQIGFTRFLRVPIAPYHR